MGTSVLIERVEVCAPFRDPVRPHLPAQAEKKYPEPYARSGLFALAIDNGCSSLIIVSHCYFASEMCMKRSIGVCIGAVCGLGLHLWSASSGAG